MRLPLLLALAALVAACGADGTAQSRSTLAAIIDRGQLIIGIEAGFFPFEVVDKQGEYQGFDIDLARQYAKDLDVEVRFEHMEWNAVQAALGTRQVDMIWSGMTATVPRSTRILFSDTYFRTRLYLLVNKSSGITSARDMRGKKIVVKLGTTGEPAAHTLFPDCEIRPLDDENNCALEVVNGRVDAFLYDRFSIERHARKYGGTTRVVTDIDSFEPYAVAMRPGDLELWRSVNLFLERARWDGRYAAIHQKHFGTPPDDAR